MIRWALYGVRKFSPAGLECVCTVEASSFDEAIAYGRAVYGAYYYVDGAMPS